ncbi:DUF2544 domain-containing protein [Salmonella enterica subsp. enterica]|nr:DUF2544 domain-containing protein [Salmonella enterica subsp. enterica]EBY5127822.1 DUF2544 domain-containing protein [Salmonella enterica subsp. enterica serovar Brazzaville]ECE6340408.1 hypothetical protein [Salmonella enterica subsp. enterica]ECG1257668.1 hypothetical protein [Salmonella enterica subsp. enterica]EEM6161714.1 DUF2544 domain-containing protein [Salmonella enterica subsp. enterica serovar Brazzaville]
MKTIKNILLIVALLAGGFISCAQAKTYNNIMLYFGIYNQVGITGHKFHVDFTTMTSQTHGECTMPIYEGMDFICTWTPSIANPPIIYLVSVDKSVSKSFCPGLPDPQSNWNCEAAVTTVTVKDVDVCPWTMRVYTTSENNYYPTPYTAPPTMTTECTVNVVPYDISWNPDSVDHEIQLNLKSTGGIITKNLHTYLMKDKQLCDGSKMDERGAYCRYVNTFTKMTPAGCGNSRVTATAVAKGINETALHDITLNINTTSVTPIDTTCEFLYVMEPQ